MIKNWKGAIIVLCILTIVSTILHNFVFQFSSEKWRLVPKFMTMRANAAQSTRNISNKSDPGQLTRDKPSNTTLLDQTPYSKLANQTCPSDSGKLIGHLNIDFEWALENYWVESRTIPVVSDQAENQSLLGHCTAFENPALVNFVIQPNSCIGRRKLAFIIPFRDRHSHLKITLGHLFPILRRQLSSFSIFVVEQDGSETFNKGRLLNTGFKFAVQAGHRSGTPYDCFVFHDVDMLSEYDTLMYTCSPGGRVDHLSTSMNKFEYNALCCGMTVGGVLAMKEEQFRAINGFPTEYWGWGAEDDDVNTRIHAKRFAIVRPQEPLGRFSMIKHERDEKNPENMGRMAILNKAIIRMETEGLEQINTKIIRMEKCSLYTKIVVDVDKPS